MTCSCLGNRSVGAWACKESTKIFISSDRISTSIAIRLSMPNILFSARRNLSMLVPAACVRTVQGVCFAVSFECLGNYSIWPLGCNPFSQFFLAGRLTQIVAVPGLVRLREWLPRCQVTRSVCGRVQSFPGNSRVRVVLPSAASQLAITTTCHRRFGYFLWGESRMYHLILKKDSTMKIQHIMVDFHGAESGRESCIHNPRDPVLIPKTFQ